jgi:plasmid stabilization system protein ParE
MNVRFAPRALVEAKRIKTWWRSNRPAAPDIFYQELDAALERIGTTPSVGTRYEHGDLGVGVRRVLLPKTKNHVYYAVEGGEIVVISVWGAPMGRGPRRLGVGRRCHDGGPVTIASKILRISRSPICR